ncbi:hypothetical protein HK096_008300, partial [Nowakowskiella sp. JEL0078]
MSLNSSELDKIDAALRNYEVLASAAARLYKAQKNQREWSLDNFGAIAFAKSRDGRFFLKLISISAVRHYFFIPKSDGILWELDISSDVKYHEDQSFFHSFLGPGYMIGLSFADDRDASNFYSKVSKKDSITSVRPSLALPPKSTVSAVSAPSSPLSPSHNSSLNPANLSAQTTVSKSPSVEKISKSFFGGKKTETKDSKKKGIQKSQISAPTNFQHVTHGSNLPEQWKELFAKAGITEESLNDKKTRKVVNKFMKEHILGAPNATKTAPPPPPSSTISTTKSRGPPPPPPSRNRAPPPPPPPRSSAVELQPAKTNQPPPPPSREYTPIQHNTPPVRDPIPVLPPRDIRSPPLPSARPPIPSRDFVEAPPLPPARPIATPPTAVAG